MKTVKIQAKNGLHARPLAEFVKMTSAFDGDVVISKDDKKANGKSMMKLLSLGVKCGDEITLELNGKDSEELEIHLADFLGKME